MPSKVKEPINVQCEKQKLPGQNWTLSAALEGQYMFVTAQYFQLLSHLISFEVVFGSKYHGFIHKNNKAMSKKLQFGSNSNFIFAILSGLQQNENIVCYIFGIIYRTSSTTCFLIIQLNHTAIWIRRILILYVLCGYQEQQNHEIITTKLTFSV